MSSLTSPSLIDHLSDPKVRLGRGDGVVRVTETSGARTPVQGGGGRSPFRYPGGKSFLVDTIRAKITQLGGAVRCYAEPYAGGAGAAIELLANNVVERISLNDADPRVYWAWHSILHRNEEFRERIRQTPVTMETWYRARSIVDRPESCTDKFDLGFATFFLNRTNRSGIVAGAGPIGGYKQLGKWTIDARYYRDTLIDRVAWLGVNSGKIEIHNKDGIDFLRSFTAKKARSTFFFIDPPYVSAGSRLYLNAMDDAKHRLLARLLKQKRSLCHWLMTYDDHPLIWELYADRSPAHLPVRYSLQKKRMQKEVVVSALTQIFKFDLRPSSPNP